MAGLIATSAQHATDLVERLNRTMRGEEAEEISPVDVNVIVQEVVREARPRWKDQAEVEGKTYAVEPKLLPDLPRIAGTSTWFER